MLMAYIDFSIIDNPGNEDDVMDFICNNDPEYKDEINGNKGMKIWA